VCIIDCSSSSSSDLSEALRIDEELSKVKGSIITMLLMQLLYDCVQHFYSLLCRIFLLCVFVRIQVDIARVVSTNTSPSNVQVQLYTQCSC
jgi:hypothetical protein